MAPSFPTSLSGAVYISQVFIKPILDDYASTVEVDTDGERRFAWSLDDELSVTAFPVGYSNCYIKKAGRNSAEWPGLASAL